MDNKEEIKLITINGHHLDLMDDFKEHLESKKENSIIYRNPNCFYNQRNNSLLKDDKRVVLFYEFSDPGRLPRRFERVSEFIEWGKQYNLYVSDYNYEELLINSINYVACYKNAHSIVIRHTHDSLVKALKYYETQYSQYNQYDDWDDDDEYRYAHYWY